METNRQWPNKAPIDLNADEREVVRRNLAEVHEAAKASMREEEARIAEYKMLGRLR